jgi:hypothetical protein
MDAFVPVTVLFFGCVAFQHWYLVPLCARALYIIIGHDGVISPVWALALLSCGTALAYTYVWFLRCKKAVGEELLLGEYHEDFFQLLPALSALCYGLRCGPGYWKFFSVPVLLAKTERLKLRILTRLLPYAMATLDGDGAGGEAVAAGPPIVNVLSTMMSASRLVMTTTTLIHGEVLGDSPCAPRGDVWVTNHTVASQRR